MSLTAHFPATDRPAGWPAWLVSVFVHAGLLAAVIWAVRERAVRGAAGEPTREAGIVLKSMTEEGPVFEGEDDVDSDGFADAASTDAALEALPSDAERSESVTAELPQLPGLGPETLSESGVGDATALSEGGAPKRRGGAGGEAQVSVFGVEGVGTKFVYVFDQSISMKGAPLAAAKQQLIASLDSLDSIHQFHIIFFNIYVNAWDAGQGRIALGTDQNKRLAKQFVRGVTASLGTLRWQALKAALNYQPDVVFFLTDADDPMPRRDVSEAITMARRNGVAIQCIEFGDGPPSQRDNFLKRLARETGGGYGYVPTNRIGI
ncbi:MAG: hypothetical protein AAF961_17345 [Planctomycetota bacterium]